MRDVVPISSSRPPVSIALTHSHTCLVPQQMCQSWVSSSEPPVRSSPPPQSTTTATTSSGLFPLSSLHFWAFSKRMLKESGAHTKGKQSCVSWDYRDCVVIHKESKAEGGQRSRSYFKGSDPRKLYLPQFLTQHETARRLSLKLITVSAQTQTHKACVLECYIKN